jgi:hypothetical protein
MQEKGHKSPGRGRATKPSLGVPLGVSAVHVRFAREPVAVLWWTHCLAGVHTVSYGERGYAASCYRAAFHNPRKCSGLGCFLVGLWFAAVNLGQGFPDWPAPQFVKDALCKAVLENANQVWNQAGFGAISRCSHGLDGRRCFGLQYCRSAGDMALVTTLANIYSKKLARSVSATTEVRAYALMS